MNHLEPGEPDGSFYHSTFTIKNLNFEKFNSRDDGIKKDKRNAFIGVKLRN